MHMFLDRIPMQAMGKAKCWVTEDKTVKPEQEEVSNSGKYEEEKYLSPWCISKLSVNDLLNRNRTIS